ncbi:hypothetical protein [Parvularcula marina]|uniref:hypothetical protein n=1 Tax=Parvularcula marina TaxID=2292771 RepID=UPI003512F279
MSLTTMQQRSFWQWPETQGFAIVLAMAGALALTGFENWTAHVFHDRLMLLESETGFAPGMDLTLWFGRLLASLPGTSEAAGLSIATAMAVPIIGLTSFLTAPKRPGRLVRSLLLCTHPLTLALVLGGAGWAVIGLYVLWRALAVLPRRRPHQGMAGSGLAIAFAWLAVPGFSAFLLPLGATLWLCAPRHMQKRFMLSYYLALFAPVAMLAGANAYAAWAFGLEWVETPLTAPMTSGLPVAILFSLCATILSGPGLMRITSMSGTATRLAALVASAFAATATGADPLAAAAMAAAAQYALAARRGEPSMLSVLSFAGGAAVVIGLGAL